jgi:hypothetical protein
MRARTNNTVTALALVIAALTLTPPTGGVTFRSTVNKQVIHFRFVAREYSLPRTSFGRGTESYVAELQLSNGAPSFVLIHYRPLQYEPSVPQSFLDYFAVHTFRAVRDIGCDATIDTISFSHMTDAWGHPVGRAPTLVYLRNAPQLPVSLAGMIPCYIVTPSDYRGTAKISSANNKAGKRTTRPPLTDRH